MTESFTISNTTKGRLPRLPFLDVKNKVLGKNYRLSLVFIGKKRSQTLNKKYRGKNKPVNILTFPLAKNEGEIYISPEVARHEAPKFEMSHRAFLLLLFIHGLLHLKGLSHGTMEEEEIRLLKKFSH